MESIQIHFSRITTNLRQGEYSVTKEKDSGFEAFGGKLLAGGLVVWVFYLLYLCSSDFETFLELDEAQVRSYFPESWLWEVHQVSPRYDCS